MGPTSDAIAQFSAISCLPNNIAADWLQLLGPTETQQLFDNDVDKTINAFLDDPDTLQKKVREIIRAAKAGMSGI
ncbi:MAG: hypothetical protein L6R39_002028 [Caloplaca ligustica]|nr:MAG: hypothetical protein L6R39_002028 [Caloplaca ligustica]